MAEAQRTVERGWTCSTVGELRMFLEAFTDEAPIRPMLHIRYVAPKEHSVGHFIVDLVEP